MSGFLTHGLTPLHVLMRPIVRWCIRIGLGYGQWSRLLKPLFLEAARAELAARGQKCSESALSLVSGLHKRDVGAFLQGKSPLADPQDAAVDMPIDRIHPSSQVVARWLAMGWGSPIALRGEDRSLDGLVKACQRDGAPLLSTRLILQDLQRRGLVELSGQKVFLVNEVGVPDIDSQEAVVHFVGAVRDHMEACLQNLHQPSSSPFLEQSLQADALHLESVAALSSASRQWWQKALQAITAQAIVLSEQDEPQGGDQRLRLGVYVYTQGPDALANKPRSHLRKGRAS